MKKDSKTYWMILLASILIGLFVGLSSIFTFIPFLIIAGIGLLTLLLNITFSKSDNQTQRSYSGNIVVAIIFSVVFTVAVFYVKSYVQEFEAKKIVNELEVYRNQNGKYPKSLNNLKYKAKSVNLHYNVSHDRYTISYSYDGWNRKSYSSRNKVWDIND